MKRKVIETFQVESASGELFTVIVYQTYHSEPSLTNNADYRTGLLEYELENGTRVFKDGNNPGCYFIQSPFMQLRKILQ